VVYLVWTFQKRTTTSKISNTYLIVVIVQFMM